MQDEKRLQMELAKSEHLRLHHEGNHSSVQEEVTQLETELQSLREEVVKAHMQLNHSSSGHENLQGLFDAQSSRLKEAEEALSAAREDLLRSKYDSEISAKEASHLQHKLDNAVQQQALLEESVSSSRASGQALEAELSRTREALLVAKDDLSKLSADHSVSLVASQEELIRLANELSVSSQDLGEKTAEAKLKASELESLRSMLVEAQKTIEFLNGEEKRYQSELSKSIEENGRLLLAQTASESKLCELGSSLSECQSSVRSLVEEKRQLGIDLAQCQSQRDALAGNHSSSRDDVSRLESEARDLRESLLKSNVDLAKATSMFEETQRLLTARDYSLVEAQKTIDFLSQEEKRLQIDLAKSEHLRLHHEGNHSSAQDEVDELEAEVQALRESSSRLNLDLIRSASDCKSLQSRLDVQSSRAKEL